jgi:hypothetical protein
MMGVKHGINKAGQIGQKLGQVASAVAPLLCSADQKWHRLPLGLRQEVSPPREWGGSPNRIGIFLNIKQLCVFS